MKLFEVYPLYDIVPTKGEGPYVFDQNGKKYLDFYGGHAVISIGHSHPHYVKKITRQINQLGFYSNSIQNPLQNELASKLGTVSKCTDYQLFLCNSGAEAMENALKVASFQTGKSTVITFKNCFHGRTSAAVNITDKASIKAPINKGFKNICLELNDTEAVLQALQTEDICAVVVEGIQGWGGIYEADSDFLKTIQQHCKQHNALLIIDEIQSGYGRTGDFFAFQKSGIQPDLVTMAKGMGNGFPIAGVLINNSISPQLGMLGTTFGGNHLACAAGIAVLEVLENESLLQNAKKMGAYLKAQLSEIPEIIEIRGRGLMLGLAFKSPIAELRKKLIFEQQVFTGSALEPNTLRLLPPLNITKKEVDIFINKLKHTLEQMKYESAISIV